eukprot:5277766-Prorocentrum_lima.AAC.1
MQHIPPAFITAVISKRDHRVVEEHFLRRLSKVRLHAQLEDSLVARDEEQRRRLLKRLPRDRNRRDHYRAVE